MMGCRWAGWIGCLPLLVLSGCSDSSTLEIRPRGDLASPTGLAGLILRVEGRTLRAGDYGPDGDGLTEAKLRIPNSGSLEIEVQLSQLGEVVAEGSVGWALRGEYEWGMDILRQVDPTEDCSGCSGSARIPIAERAQTMPGEALWFMWGGQPKGSDIVF